MVNKYERVKTSGIFKNEDSVKKLENQNDGVIQQNLVK